MSGGGGSSFCLDPLWDSNLTWFTNDPDFTLCFHSTALVYLPGMDLQNKIYPYFLFCCIFMVFERVPVLIFKASKVFKHLKHFEGNFSQVGNNFGMNLERGPNPNEGKEKGLFVFCSLRLEWKTLPKT